MSYSDAYDPDDGIAIIGLAGRFPGARNVDEFWQILVQGRETVSHFSQAQLDPALPDEMAARLEPNYVRARGVLEDVEQFDAGFFGILAGEAEVLDPQQRVFLETAWEALEAAGHDPRKFPGPIGVFAGMSNNTYRLQHLASRPDVTEIVGWLTTMMANEKDYLATRVAYKLDLRGPALNLQTACSTSLLAVSTAVQSLLTFQCDMALAGGVSIMLPQHRGYLYQEGGITSSDGHCRTFDERATGTVFSNGVGIVALRRLSDALADGDTIYAVIKGAGVNNDGASKVSFTAPSVDGHADVIALAQALAGIDPQTISYIEAHGTATPLGDPVEIAGLAQAFRAGGATGVGFCDIGSVKSNIGHLDAAAGVTGLIKTALCLYHKTLPPSLHFTSPNPELALADTPFRVVTSLRPWQAVNGTPRRAGVSSFGTGGTNVHLVLEEAPARTTPKANGAEQLLVLSARSAKALDAATSRLRQHLVDHPEHRLSDVAFTLQVGRRRFTHRRAIVAAGIDEAIQRIEALDPKTAATVSSTVEDASVAFLFPGQGAQSVRMAQGLYDADPAFRAEVDECSAILRPELGFDLREVLYPPPGAEGPAAQRLSQTEVTQPALFVIEYALAMAWRRLGIEPDGMMGHSVGEYVAACLGGLFTRDDALRLVAARGRLMQTLPPGAMLAVRADADEVRKFLSKDLEIAGENAPGLTVISGAIAAIEDFEARLAERDLTARRLVTSHAFHSAMMDPILEEFARIVDAVPRSAPSRPWISCLTGDWITSEQAQDSNYWVAQLRRPVLFAKGVARLLEASPRVTLEVGPGQQLTGLAKLAVTGRAAGVATFAPADDPSSLLLAAGRLWTAGVSLDWSVLHAPGEELGLQRIALPTYPFERKRYWVDPAPTSSAVPAVQIIAANTSLQEDKMTAPSQSLTSGRRDGLVDRLRALFADLSGMDAAGLDPRVAFLELGLDSLSLTQAALTIGKTFGVKIPFRDLMDELSTIDALAAHLDRILPAEASPVASPVPSPVAAPVSMPRPQAVTSAGVPSPAGSMERLIADQLEVMRQQLEVMRAAHGAAGSVEPPAPRAAEAPASAAFVPFGPYRPPNKGPMAELTPGQKRALSALLDRYTRRTAESKRATAANRPHLADPRSVAGFRGLWKEGVYPIVTVRSSGSRLWDVDGNEYIDLTNGFGSVFFGHNADFIREAVKSQLDRGIEIGPQSPLAGEVAARVAAMVGMDRVAFCNTGSEAVTAAIRLARTVTGRDKIAMFAGAYHGIFDEVLARPGGQRAMPTAPGIPMSMFDNVVVLDYGSPAALEYLDAHGSEFAAVLVEPVQSRRPDLQPREFLHELRRVTEASGTALVFDELVTGFRTHAGGAQAIFGVRADLATYGKVIGGGLPIGIVSGARKYMDALDGGAWRFGDDSIPEVGVTFFAGTFVRHPLALAAARAVVERLEQGGPDLQRDLNARATKFASRLMSHAQSVGAPVRIGQFSSWMYVDFPSDVPHAGLFYLMMRDRGIHIWEGRCWFLTTAHTEADLDTVFEAFRDTLAEMQAGSFLPGETPPPDAGARDDARLPLTEPQAEMWAAAAMGPQANCAYNQCFALTLHGPLRLESLQAALDGVIARHDALRAVIAPDGESQTLRSVMPVEMRVLDLSALDHEPREREIEELLRREAQTPFDLAEGPLVRALALRESAHVHRLVLTVHHIVCDGWSSAVLFSDLGLLYAADRIGVPAHLPPAASYREYVAQQTGPDALAAARIDEDYWAGLYPSGAPVMALPFPGARPANKTYGSGREQLELDGELCTALKQTGAKYGATLFATLLAAYEVLLHRLSSQSDFVIGIPFAGQAQQDNQQLVAHCVSTVPLRAGLDPATSFSDHLRAVARDLADAQDHSRVTFGSLVRRLRIARDRSRTPLVATTFTIDKIGTPFDFGDVTVAGVATPKSYSNFELLVTVVDNGRGIVVECDYNTDLLDAPTLRRWLRHYETLLRGIASRPDQPLHALPLLEVDERHALVAAGEEVSFAASVCLHERFEAWAKRSPDRVAVVCDGESLSYGALDRRANALAFKLRALGVGRGVLVGLRVERSLGIVVGILGILKAGGAYVPLDPAYPRDRVDFMLADSGVTVVVTQAAFVEELQATHATLVDIDQDRGEAAQALETLESGVQPHDLAYVIYTSGSTGKPKGVLISHFNVTRLFDATARWFDFGETDVWTLFHSYAFDFSVWEMWGALLFGGRLVVVPYWVSRSPQAFRQLVIDQNVTVLNQTPSAFRQFIDADLALAPAAMALPYALRYVIFGGEALQLQSLRPWMERYGHMKPQLVNMYGITETTVHVTYRRITLSDLEAVAGSVIGVPIPDLRLLVLDEHQQPVPIGVPGELYVGGAGVSRGYLKRPELTAQRFVPDPTSAGASQATLYRTGDLVRRLADGDLEYLGRIDDQVKIRGFRIELGEIEAVLRQHPAIAQAIVIAREDSASDKRLVAYIVAHEAAPSIDALKNHLRAHLPDYMVPAHFVPLAELPLTPNGKVDRKALPEPSHARLETTRPFIAPRTPTEETVAAIWASVLRAPRVSIEDNFFDMGGHSIKAVQVIAALRSTFGVDAGMRHLFEQPTIAGLAGIVDVLAIAAHREKSPEGSSAGGRREEFEI